MQQLLESNDDLAGLLVDAVAQQEHGPSIGACMGVSREFRRLAIGHIDPLVAQWSATIETVRQGSAWLATGGRGAPAWQAAASDEERARAVPHPNDGAQFLGIERHEWVSVFCAKV